MGDNLGYCDFDNLEIWIIKGLRRTKAEEILVHEIIHATTHPSFNGHDKLDDETFVTAVAPVLLGVIK